MQNRALVVFSLLLTLSPAAFAEEFYCEVMDVEGSATLSNAATSGKALQEGDLLAVEDVVEVGPSSYVDLAYDRDWNNVTRIEENSSIRLRSLYPTTVELSSGGIFAKLKLLPKESSFDVETPTAIASVRGTEYRTTYLDGETQIYNVSDSDVYVYGLDESGRRQPSPVVLRNSQATQVQRRGQAPTAPRWMESHEVQHVARFREGIDRKIRQNIERGRVGKIQDIGKVERLQAQRRERGEGPPRTMSGDEAREKARQVYGEPRTEQEPEHRLTSMEGNRPTAEEGRSAPVGLSEDRWESGTLEKGEKTDVRRRVPEARPADRRDPETRNDGGRPREEYERRAAEVKQRKQVTSKNTAPPAPRRQTSPP